MGRVNSASSAGTNAIGHFRAGIFNQTALAAQSDEKAKGVVRKFIPTSQAVYGVRLPLLNQIAKEHREGGFELAEALWKSGAFEETPFP